MIENVPAIGSIYFFAEFWAMHRLKYQNFNQNISKQM